MNIRSFFFGWSTTYINIILGHSISWTNNEWATLPLQEKCPDPRSAFQCVLDKVGITRAHDIAFEGIVPNFTMSELSTASSWASPTGEDMVVNIWHVLQGQWRSSLWSTIISLSKDVDMILKSFLLHCPSRLSLTAKHWSKLSNVISHNLQP